MMLRCSKLSRIVTVLIILLTCVCHAASNAGLYAQPSSIRLESDRVTLRKGQTYKIAYQLEPENTVGHVLYYSTNPSIVTVTANGVISALKEGSATVLISINSKAKAELEVSVKAAYQEADRLLRIAHRGGAGNTLIENSLEAFVRAESAGANMIELDIRKTADGVLVVYHDSTVEDGNTVRGIAVSTLEQLLSYDPSICTYEQVLAALCDTDMIIRTEFKQSGIEEDALLLAEKYNMTDKINYVSFNEQTISNIHQLSPQSKTGLLIDSTRKLNSILQHPGDHSFDFVSAKASILSASAIVRIHLAGWEVDAWTVNQSKRMRSLISNGVDGIVTDYPERLCSVVNDPAA